MIKTSQIDYSDFDRPEVTYLLFHPRPETEYAGHQQMFENILIPVEKNINIGARFYSAGKQRPIILFFHGNGEIAADYNDMAQIYNQINLNFMPVDYRGYGQSDGTPTVTAMMRDCHQIFQYTENWLSENGYKGPVVLMGRSLGSASALELAAEYKDSVGGLIIESGFSFVIPLLKLIGVQAESLALTEKQGLRNYEKIKTFDKPTLIIHAEYDDIIPLKEGKLLYQNCSAPDKKLLVVPNAGHNDIFAAGIQLYMESIYNLVNRVV